MITIDFDIFFWHVLANLHFNENVKRETHQSKDGSDYIKVTYPKFKVGEEVVGEVAVPRHTVRIPKAVFVYLWSLTSMLHPSIIKYICSFRIC